MFDLLNYIACNVFSRNFFYFLLYRICDLAILIAGLAVSFSFIKSSKSPAKEPTMRVLIGFFGTLLTKEILSFFIFFIKVILHVVNINLFYGVGIELSLLYNAPILGNVKKLLGILKFFGEYSWSTNILSIFNSIFYLLFIIILTAIEAGYFYLLATKPADEIIPVVKTYVDKLSNKLAVPTVETPVVEKEEKPTPKAKPSKPIDAEALLKYKKLLDVGAITQEEFDQKKKEIMGD